MDFLLFTVVSMGFTLPIPVGSVACVPLCMPPLSLNLGTVTPTGNAVDLFLLMRRVYLLLLMIVLAQVLLEADPRTNYRYKKFIGVDACDG